MRALLVQPEFPATYWGFQYSLQLTGNRCAHPPLGLITVAALLSDHVEVRLVDENVEPLRDDHLAWADVVLVGGMRVQARAMSRVLARARASGLRTMVGGPAASATPHQFDDADVVFVGEAERRADEIAAALLGSYSGPRILLPRPGAERPTLSSSPVPRYDLLDRRAYQSMSLQYSRGCPFSCEFCDVIKLFGRKPRVKSADQVLAELDAIRELGFRGSVFVVDDNFIGNKREARGLLTAIAAWQKRHRRPMDLYTEASVNLANDPAMIDAMVDAGFSTVFVGIETPSHNALCEAGKTQNLRFDLAEAVDRLTGAGLEVFGGFIVGFDADDAEIFDAQADFISAVPIPVAMVGMLNALPGTALWDRLEREGRLHERASGDQFDRPNFVPTMGEETLLREYAGLLRSLYSPKAYLERCRLFLERVGRMAAGGRVLRWKDIATLFRVVLHLGLLGRRRRWFWRLMLSTLFRAPRELPRAVAHAIMGEHMVRYTHEHVLPRIDSALAGLAA